MSSFERGLLANLVAARCSQLEANHVRAIWFVQWRSWQPGGLPALAQEINRHCTRSGITEGQLEQLCLDPHFPIAEEWKLVDQYRAAWVNSRPASARTAIGERIAAALEYTAQAHCLTLIDGASRLGKTFAVKKWIEQNAGAARYAQVPSTNDDIGFFRAIGDALGVSSSLQLKAAEIRARIEQVLQTGQLMLCLDEAHYAWPQNWQRYAAPARINWIMTALVNHGVPVALITTPQFYTDKKRVEDLTGWNSDQFTGRIGHIERLPETLSHADLLAVARSMLPALDAEWLGHLATFAEMSKRHLALIDTAAHRATWLASQAGRTAPAAEDVKRAVRDIATPEIISGAEIVVPAVALRKTLATPSRRYGQPVAMLSRGALERR